MYGCSHSHGGGAAFRGTLGVKVVICKPADPAAKGLLERAHGRCARGTGVDLDFNPGALDPADVVVVSGVSPDHAAHGCIREACLHRTQDVVERTAGAVIRPPRPAACHCTSVHEPDLSCRWWC